MTNKGVIEIKISSIQEYLKILEDNYKQRSQKEIEDDLFLKTSLERHLYLLTQEVIDLAEIIISYRDFRRPDSYSEAFEILKENTIISVDLMKKMIDMVGFRNKIAHDYKKLKFDVVYNVLQNDLEDVKEFVNNIQTALFL
ncbi:MAG: hypothetical protein A2312_04420 [Candidatus Staskawiczbacteria bacterium RIFOXYB2_FULL_32_9]|uniref:DUF86 domain-containing protein n=1 Tax=Candidatus Staskawiczbacteria bacterium RIFOXYD1_FULL_32_13 TaxID=1802234 RepID=A0A1G2JMQ6_9BACT|nr:MAG: hypothetical protein UR22_C0009G0004 [Parcubacteria group bacterium GW2011_GWC2_32_10]OGZ78759.1 MAG: hypothetical protein A2360_01065 [Candidatus Staskawiczbacteria bacterium RIFOXYB1_FULL_32_11]OGZ81867.1 MAG: hypothetical protein A2312_04420 [Candidatus Staskawiczbacteria bacterium RIFOXYB2_FULL_32_9]OGZ85320.1 MAG: hypothetical protein A2463_00850 [Candidatus Staskawiczbacteria bacterium RIFOXYC2_FULL_32_10]OGZ87528.1 MAG: hypothetical protein A2561_00875 [Candidatus Staskawiczbacte